MKRTIIPSMCLAGALALALSCNKETPASSDGNGRTVITAMAEADGVVFLPSVS